MSSECLCSSCFPVDVAIGAREKVWESLEKRIEQRGNKPKQCSLGDSIGGIKERDWENTCSFMLCYRCLAARSL